MGVASGGGREKGTEKQAEKPRLVSLLGVPKSGVSNLFL